MLKNFPQMQQEPASLRCFSTAVRAILQYWGRSSTADEASRWCDEGPSGCALDQIDARLDSHGIDVDVWTRDFESKLRLTIGDPIEPSPVLVTIQSDLFGPWATNHAVVVLGIESITGSDTDEEHVFYMDPLSGQIEHEEYSSFLKKWEEAEQWAFVIRPG